MKIWNTKYALTTGVTIEEVEPPSDRYPDMVKIERKDNSFFRLILHGEGRDWHRTRESALKRVAAVRAAKIRSLEKQIARLSEGIEIPE